MARSETRNIENNSGSTAWFQLAGVEHKNVAIFSSDTEYYIGDDDPNVVDPIANNNNFRVYTGGWLTFSDLHSPLWAQINNGNFVRVIRGEVLVNLSDVTVA